MVLSLPRLADDRIEAVKWTTCFMGSAVSVVILNLPVGSYFRTWAFLAKKNLLTMGNRKWDLEKPELATF